MSGDQARRGVVRSRPAAPWRRTVTAVVLVGAAYYLGARLGLSLSLVEHNVTPLWPPTGIALAAFLLLGRSTWPGVALAALAVNLPISTGLLPALVTAAGNTLAPLVAVIVLERVGFRRQLDRLHDAMAIVFLGALASMTISATVGATTLLASGVIETGELASAWVVWWTGDAMGILAVAPFLLCVPLFWELEPWRAVRWAEAAAILVLTTALVVWTTYTELPVLFVVLPVLAWASWRLQLRGAAPAALIASLVVTWSATHGHGQFERGSLLDQMLTLQAFNASVALTSFFLAALVTERVRRARQIAETLQRSLLPDKIPDIPGVAVAVRYVPATADMRVGGDWYDVIQLRGGLIGLAIGDVAGHGLQAAAAMGQLRMAVRAYAVQDPSPAAVMNGLHTLAAGLPMAEMVTLLYLVYDPDTGTVRFTNAGHPPALVINDGDTRYLDGGPGPPLGVLPEWEYAEATRELSPGSTLLLYTDGLVERRTLPIQQGLDQLRAEASGNGSSDVEALCDQLLSALAGNGKAVDDIALVALRPLVLAGTPLSLVVPADARMLYQVRHTVRRWLRESQVGPHDEGEILIACGEACANVVRHAYGASPGDLRIDARLVEGSVELAVRDRGEWRVPADRGGGWGLRLIEGLMDSVDIDRGPEGTEVRMRRGVLAGRHE